MATSHFNDAFGDGTAWRSGERGHTESIGFRTTR
jgi:hypothetical protein